MYIEPINVELKPGTSFTVLGKSSVLKETDYVRRTVYASSYIDDYSEKGMNWQLAKTALPGWIGHVLGELTNVSPHFEVIRIND